MTQSFIAEVIVVHPDLALAPTLRAVSEREIQLESQPLSDPASPLLFYSVTGPTFQDFDAALADDHTVREWQVTTEGPDWRLYQIRLSSRVKVLSPKITDMSIRVVAARNAERGWALQLHTPEKDSLGAFWDYCREEDVHFQLEKLYSTGPATTRPGTRRLTSDLTDRQREVARTATRMGYYETDGASAAEVAAELDISPSTLSTHLRRSTATVFHHLFQDG